MFSVKKGEKENIYLHVLYSGDYALSSSGVIG